MTVVSLAICVSLLIGFIPNEVGAEESNSPRAVQIVIPINHTFQLELNELKNILENDNIKDRNIVVVSIAGALRQGKSFLLNFFIKYLDAQVITYLIRNRYIEFHDEPFLYILFFVQ